MFKIDLVRTTQLYEMVIHQMTWHVSNETFFRDRWWKGKTQGEFDSCLSRRHRYKFSCRKRNLFLTKIDFKSSYFDNFSKCLRFHFKKISLVYAYVCVRVCVCVLEAEYTFKIIEYVLENTWVITWLNRCLLAS